MDYTIFLFHMAITFILYKDKATDQALAQVDYINL